MSIERRSSPDEIGHQAGNLSSRITNFLGDQPTDFAFLAAALLIAGAAAWPILREAGLLNTRGGGDSPFLLQRLHQLTAALADGHFPVRWMPDANYGYGYPFFNFYAPLSIYIAALFRILGFGYVRAIQLAQLAGFLTAAGAIFWLARRWFRDPWAGLLAATAYTLAPFHMVNVYVRGDSLAEFWAMAFYPLTLLAVGRVWDRNRGMLGRIVPLALSYAALILCHNISALIFSPFLLLYLLLDFWRIKDSQVRGDQRRERKRTADRALLVPLFALTLALALSAWFWLPALAEQDLAQLEPVTSGYFHYSNHFRGRDLIQTSLFFDYDAAGGGAFRMGLVQAATVLAGAAALIVFRAPRGKPGQIQPDLPRRVFVILALLAGSFMVTPLSRPLWDILPLLPFTQFPWRFLSIQALVGALATAGLALWPFRGRRAIMCGALAALALAGLGDVRPDYLYLAANEITAESLAQYEWFTGNIGTTVSAEYLPPTVQPRAYTSSWLNSGQRAIVQGLEGRLIAAELVNRRTARQTWQVQTAGPEVIVLPILHWPGWEATLDGTPVPIGPAAGSGLISLSVPEGAHSIVVSLGQTAVRRAGTVISLLTLLLLSGGWLLLKRPRPGWPVIYAFGALALLAVAARLAPKESWRSGTQSWDFAQLGYLHHEPEGIPFANGARLTAYAYDQETVEAGEELIITLTWAGTGSGVTTLALATPAANRYQDAPLLTSQTLPLSDGRQTYHLGVPIDAPPGLYVPRLSLSDGPALTSSGQPRGDLFLRPLRILNSGQEALLPDVSLDARVWRVYQPAPNSLAVHLQWATGKQLTENYNVSLRLTDTTGQQVAEFDSQPGYGYLPSSGWPLDTWVNDWLTLPLPAELAASEAQPLALVARLYEVASGTAVLTRRLGELTGGAGELAFRATEPVFDLPADVTPTELTFSTEDATAVIGLRGYTLRQGEEQLDLTLYWQALTADRPDFFHFVHLVDPATGQIGTQHDSMPLHNSYPTSQWLVNEIVADPLTLDLSEVLPGSYRLAVGLYRNLGTDFPRLAIADENGRDYPDNRFFLPVTIVVGE